MGRWESTVAAGRAEAAGRPPGPCTAGTAWGVSAGEGMLREGEGWLE
jgi:hypothetical protein